MSWSMNHGLDNERERDLKHGMVSGVKCMLLNVSMMSMVIYVGKVEELLEYNGSVTLSRVLACLFHFSSLFSFLA